MASAAGRSLLMELPDELLIKISEFVDCASILNWTRSCWTLRNAGKDSVAKYAKRHRKYRCHATQVDREPLSVVKTLRLITSNHAAADYIRTLRFETSRTSWPLWLKRDSLRHMGWQPVAINAETSLMTAEQMEKYGDLLSSVLPAGRATVRRLRQTIAKGDDRSLKLLCVARCPNLRRLIVHNTPEVQEQFRPEPENLLAFICMSILQHAQLYSAPWPTGFLYLQELDIKIDNEPESGFDSTSIMLFLLLPKLRKLKLELSKSLIKGASLSKQLATRPSPLEELTLHVKLIDKSDLEDILRRTPNLRKFDMNSACQAMDSVVKLLVQYQKTSLVDLYIDGFDLSEPGYEGSNRIEDAVFRRSEISQLTSLKVLRGFPASLISRHFDRREQARLMQYQGWKDTVLGIDPKIRTWHRYGAHDNNGSAERYCAGFDDADDLPDAMDIDKADISTEASDTEWLGVTDLRMWFPPTLEQLEMRFSEVTVADGTIDVEYREDIPQLRALGRRLVQFVQAGGKLKKVVLDKRFNIEKIGEDDLELLEEAGMQLLRPSPIAVSDEERY